MSRHLQAASRKPFSKRQPVSDAPSPRLATKQSAGPLRHSPRAPESHPKFARSAATTIPSQSAASKRPRCPPASPLEESPRSTIASRRSPSLPSPPPESASSPNRLKLHNSPKPQLARSHPLGFLAALPRTYSSSAPTALPTPLRDYSSSRSPPCHAATLQPRGAPAHAPSRPANHRALQRSKRRVKIKLSKKLRHELRGQKVCGTR